MWKKFCGHLNWIEKCVCSVLIFVGLALRLVAYFENRNLWTDEVAVALNIAERDFFTLLQPLDYFQYAPPLFLWATKISTVIFGLGEKALRLFPLLCGMFLLFPFYSLLRRFLSTKSIWYPLTLLATGIFFIRYSTELKQYMPDAFISLGLIWIAIKLPPDRANKRFLPIWIAIGSIALWSSMPSIFILFSILCYYAAVCVQKGETDRLKGLVILFILWGVQFLCYYKFVLSAQISSEYLINFHNKYFFSLSDGKKDLALMEAIFKSAGGNTAGMLFFNEFFFVLGCIVMTLKRKPEYILLLLPILSVIAASALHQYSLIPRLTLFIMPLILIIIGVGLDYVMTLSWPIIMIAITVVLVLILARTEPLKSIYSPIREEQITDALAFIKGKEIRSEQLYVYTGAIESFRYYTNVHPDKSQWSKFKNAHLITEHFDTTILNTQAQNSVVLLYTIPFDSYDTKKMFERHFRHILTFKGEGCEVFLFTK